MSPEKEYSDMLEIERAVQSGKTISLKSFVLTDYGEKILESICRQILQKHNREDLLDIVYPASKELAINATKANYKRLIFTELGLDPENDEEYRKGMALFKEKLNEKILRENLPRFRELNLPVVITFYYSANVLNIKVKNMFPMLAVEESRVREKFSYAQSFSSLLEFYLAHGDESEGAGLGITMVGILLDETGIDRHSFTLHVKPGYSETAAKLEIPLSSAYVPKRVRFERELAASGLSREEFREQFH